MEGTKSLPGTEGCRGIASRWSRGTAFEIRQMGRQGIQPLSFRRKSHAGGFSSGLPICAIPETSPMQQSDRTAVCPM